jgi:rod shape determining protein RodA
VNYFKKYDFSFIGTAFAIFLLGILNLYSATHEKEYYQSWHLYNLQLIKFFIAMVIMFAVSMVHPKNYFRYSYFFYFFNLGLLFLVLAIGHVGMGAQRWLSIGPLKFQPSEMMKISVVLFLARWFTRHDPDRDLGFREIWKPAIFAFLPAILIIKQPDLGTGLLILLITGIMFFYKRLKVKTIIILFFISVVSGVGMYQFGLREYQKKRILTFIKPNEDAKGSGYNAIQSEIAIGSGQLFGKGFKKSSQASLKYLPENHTDFVFSVFNEEHGFFGAMILIALYFILFFRMIKLAMSVLKFYDSMLVIGLMSIFFWHTTINMGMVMGLAPIVGLPLPFMSYGGSSLFTFGICIGMITSISNSKNIF